MGGGERGRRGKEAGSEGEKKTVSEGRTSHKVPSVYWTH